MLQLLVVFLWRNNRQVHTDTMIVPETLAEIQDLGKMQAEAPVPWAGVTREYRNTGCAGLGIQGRNIRWIDKGWHNDAC